MSREVADVLRKARELISAPERWTQGCVARDAEGYSVEENEADAVRWCGYGAVGRCAGGRTYDASYKALDAACGCDFPEWQDAPERTHAEVMAVFGKAIAAEEAQP